MSDALYQQIRQNLGRKSTAELKRIIAEQHTGDWSDDAIRAATDLLAARPQEPDEPVVTPATAPSTIEPAPRPLDPRGQGIFTLTPEQIADYRSKIQLLGWVFCIIGALIAILLTVVPVIYGSSKISTTKPLAMLLIVGITGLGIGLTFIAVGRGLIRLNPHFRIPGLILSALILITPFVNKSRHLDLIGIASILIGLAGIFWLGKRGSVLNLRPNKDAPAPSASRPNKAK